ncbi:MAG TPA: phospholipid scramblase-related protein [Nocardioidaceae bacterium]|nr:phospholipid scramblase-related protein [Nocardioidaceae bacterium]
MTDTLSDDQDPGWYPDPWGKHEHRYFDGDQWTEHVASHGKQSVDPPSGEGGPVPTVNRAPDKVRRDAVKAAVTADTATGSGSILDEPVLVVNQKAKLVELHNEFAFYDQHGEQIGAVRQVGQSPGKKVIRVVSTFDQFATQKLQVVDMEGTVLLALTRPAKFMKSRIIVEDGSGRPVGEVMQKNIVGKIRFDMLTGPVEQGSIKAQNWRAWNFNIFDAQGNEIARVTKTWEGLAKTMFTTADNYVVQIHRRLPEPLRSLVVASALCIDTALKQDTRGLS